MSSDGWGSSFHYSGPNPFPEINHVELRVDVEPSGIAINAIWQNNQAIARSNKVPTHDPYTNPNAELYYSCNCGAILDPGTKRFSELNGYASKAGWKIRFTDTGYVPYCGECGKGVD